MLLQSHLRSVNEEAETIEKAAFVAYDNKGENKNHFIPVVPNESLANAPYILHLLPALPSVWENGKVTGLRARGGFEVDIIWKAGKLVEAKIHATKDETFRIYSNGVLSEEYALKKGETKVWIN
jgi:alpha-L-fucosidase 2